MKNYPSILTSIDREFARNLAVLRSDPLFTENKNIYTDDDKKRIARIWCEIIKPFLKLRKILRFLMWRSILTFGSKNSFVVKYATVTTYHNMVCEIQKSFWPHEEFIRQYLDDTFRENYSTLARYMYHIRFYSVLSYPREYFLTLRDEVNSSLYPLFERPEPLSWERAKRLSHDFANIWYYMRFKISRILTWIAKYGGRVMMHIRISRRNHGLITRENLDSFTHNLEPGDILLTRSNWWATNLNIPGFWKHMAMYIGTWDDIAKKYGHTMAEWWDGNTHYIIEAIGAGIQIIPIKELAGHNDYMWALRPRLSHEKKEHAVKKTLSHVGKAYDYSFNFYSDVNYVCSTLVTKAYLPESKEDEWLHITLTRIGMSITYPPNDLVKKYALEYYTQSKELDFVWFIDAIDAENKSFLSTEDEFRKTAERPKLSFFLP